MKFKKLVSLLSVAIAGLSVLLFEIPQRGATKSGSEKSFTVDLTSILPKGAKLVEVNKDPPSWMEFLLQSDFVVIATGSEGKVIGKRGIDLIHSDASERIIGYVCPLRIESILFSKTAFENKTDLASLPYPSLEVYYKLGPVDEPILNGTRYLLFLKEIPKDEDIFATLDLDKSKTYYRPYVGMQSLFPSSGIDMHGATKKGKIDITSGQGARLGNAVQQICQALSPGNKRQKLQNLQTLTKSGNKELRENAEYAIEYLSQEKGE